MVFRLTSADASRVYALVEECSELWDDPPAWQHHLAASAEQLLGGFCGKLLLHREDSVLELAVGNAIDAAAREVFRRFAENGGPKLLPGYDTVLRQVQDQGCVSGTTAGVPGGVNYYRLDVFQRYMRPVHAHHTLFASARCPAAGLVLSVSLSRGASERAFGDREAQLVGGLAEALAQRVGRRLALHAHRGRHDLSPRERQTLQALLEGDSEKQIAARLGLSRQTVHDHVKSLYRYFRAQSRGELMAYFVRRAPAPKEPPPAGPVRLGAPPRALPRSGSRARARG